MIDICGIEKRYGDVRALDHLELKIPQGELFGYIGPNGAGKTTTIKILATLEFPDAGAAAIQDFDVVSQPEQVRRVIGYMPELFGLYDQMPVWEYLDTFARIYDVPVTEVDNVLDVAGLMPKRDALSGALSKGNRQRLFIARILLHNPAVLLLDEPASGLDPLARIELRELLKELHRMGKTILISSHILADLEEICTSVGVIEHGKMLVSGDIASLKQKLLSDFSVRMLVDGEIEPVLALLQQEASVYKLEVRNGAVEFSFRGERGHVHRLLSTLVAAARVYSFEATEGSLEDIFLRITHGTVS